MRMDLYKNTLQLGMFRIEKNIVYNDMLQLVISA